MQVPLHYMLSGSGDLNARTHRPELNCWTSKKRIHGIGSEDQGITCTHNPVITSIGVTFSAKHQSLAYTESSFQRDNSSCNGMDNPPTRLLTPLISATRSMMVYRQLPTPALMSLKGNLVDNCIFFERAETCTRKQSNLNRSRTEQVILQSLKIVLARETYQITKNFPLVDPTDLDSVGSPGPVLWNSEEHHFWALLVQQFVPRRS